VPVAVCPRCHQKRFIFPGDRFCVDCAAQAHVEHAFFDSDALATWEEVAFVVNADPNDPDLARLVEGDGEEEKSAPDKVEEVVVPPPGRRRGKRGRRRKRVVCEIGVEMVEELTALAEERGVDDIEAFATKLLIEAIERLRGER